MPSFSRPRPVAPALGLALCVIALAAPVADADDVPTATDDIVLFEFTPHTLEVSVGTSVTWVNHDSIVHSVTSGTPDSMDATDALFDSGLFDQNQTFTFTFTAPGVYAYHCSRHAFMQGTITVV